MCLICFKGGKTNETNLQATTPENPVIHHETTSAYGRPNPYPPYHGEKDDPPSPAKKMTKVKQDHFPPNNSPSYPDNENDEGKFNGSSSKGKKSRFSSSDQATAADTHKDTADKVSEANFDEGNKKGSRETAGLINTGSPKSSHVDHQSQILKPNNQNYLANQVMPRKSASNYEDPGKPSESPNRGTHHHQPNKRGVNGKEQQEPIIRGTGLQELYRDS